MPWASTKACRSTLAARDGRRKAVLISLLSQWRLALVVRPGPGARESCESLAARGDFGGDSSPFFHTLRASVNAI
eukprot:222897-Pleurochrysis_carterae.AAC.1